MMRQIFAAKKHFHGAFLAEQSEKYVSPGRGWYHIYTFQPDKRDEEQLKWLPMEEDETLVLLRLDIGAFRNRSIDAQTLAFVERILKCFAEKRKDIILRILYDTDGHGMAHEPASIDMVCEHMRSLGKAVKKQASAILLVQGLFVGSWGEMHDSKFLDPEAIRNLWETWQEATEGAIPLAVRKPVYARMLGDTDSMMMRFWRMRHIWEHSVESPEKRRRQQKAGVCRMNMRLSARGWTGCRSEEKLSVERNAAQKRFLRS